MLKYTAVMSDVDPSHVPHPEAPRPGYISIDRDTFESDKARRVHVGGLVNGEPYRLRTIAVHAGEQGADDEHYASETTVWVVDVDPEDKGRYTLHLAAGPLNTNPLVIDYPFSDGFVHDGFSEELAPPIIGYLLPHEGKRGDKVGRGEPEIEIHAYVVDLARARRRGGAVLLA